MLDEAGFGNAKIVVSDSLDEHKISNLKENGAPIDIWGVGTNLVTAKDQPALGGVYKLGAIQDGEGQWHHRVKMSNTPIKVSNPGKLQIMRLRNSEVWMDVLIDELDESPVTEVISLDGSDQRKIDIREFEPLLKPITSSDLCHTRIFFERTVGECCYTTFVFIEKLVHTKTKMYNRGKTETRGGQIMIVFYSSAYRQMAQTLINALSAVEGRISKQIFPDGERYYRIEDDLRGKEVLFIGGAYDDSSTMETYDLACELYLKVL